MAVLEYSLFSYERAQEAEPEWGVPYFMLGNYYQATAENLGIPGNLEKARAYYLKAKEYMPDNEELAVRLQQITEARVNNSNQDEGRTDGFEPIPFD